MLNYKNNKINSNYIYLKKNFDLLYFKELINNSTFIIYFNCNKIFNKDLYNIYFINLLNNNIKLNYNLNFLHFIIFKLLFNLLIVILFYVINFIKNIYK